MRPVIAVPACLWLLLAACETGGDGPTLPDADLTKPMCTGVVFDSCTTAAGCMSGNCKLFEDALIQVCTTTCSSTMPCPNDASGASARTATRARRSGEKSLVGTQGRKTSTVLVSP